MRKCLWCQKEHDESYESKYFCSDSCHSKFEIKENHEREESDAIVCPYCDYIIEDDLYEYYEDEFGSDMECENCGKTFSLTVSVTYSFTTEATREEVEKEFKERGK